MANLKDGTSMAYDFVKRHADVVYPAGQTINVRKLQDYFDDATDGDVRRINVTVGNSLFVTLARDDQGKWVAIEGLKDCADSGDCGQVFRLIADSDSD
jgi:hypothetical protein